jgi:3-methyladenine DNA glycosylase AlkD
MWMRVRINNTGKERLVPDEAFKISDLLMNEKEDLVHKGFCWLLKEESRVHQNKVYDYVLRNRHLMPRTTLRYSIKFMPEELRKEAMKKPSKTTRT